MPRKGCKRGTCVFNSDLAQEYPYIVKKAKFGPGTDSDVYCTICKRYFNIANNGKFQIRAHVKSLKHQDAVVATGGAVATSGVVRGVGVAKKEPPGNSSSTTGIISAGGGGNGSYHSKPPPLLYRAKFSKVKRKIGPASMNSMRTIIKKNAPTISMSLGHVSDDDSFQPSGSHIDNPVLIDSDGGIYDAWAMALALRSADPGSHPPRKINIVGITTVNGCTTVENATRNVYQLVNSLGKNLPPIPIFKGMDSAYTKAPGSSTLRPSFFGSDGYGDILDLPETPEVRIHADNAITAIIKMAEKYKGKLTILCLGPLTNLALAVKLKPEIRQYVKEIFIVGGNSEGIGNMTVSSEFNFFVDPEAANVVLESFNLCPVFLLPWETCMKSGALSQSFRVDTIGNLETPEMELLNKLERNFLDKLEDQWIVPDAILMGCFLNREIMRKTEHYHCTVEIQGMHTRGMMVVDKNFIGHHPAKNVTLITQVNRKLFWKMIIWAVEEMKGNDSDDGEDNESHKSATSASSNNIKIEPESDKSEGE